MNNVMYNMCMMMWRNPAAIAIV